ncbi:uncharacterized protein LOC134530377 [Bacillus rossius redtenbacheri]|uniref:uncharacterized protein LOC134530377 n=1 Tax=Bacillus rossius redtenbacheri TaxID=93214 RepID=UPI002FDEABE1
MHEPLFDIFGTTHREPTLMNRQITDNLKGNDLMDLKAVGSKSMQKKALVDVKNTLGSAPLTDNRGGPLKSSSLSTPVFNKAKVTPFKSPALKPTAGKKVQSKSDSSDPFVFSEPTSKTFLSEGGYGIPNMTVDMASLAFEDEDRYEDLMTESQHYTSEQIHKLVNFWELTQSPSESNISPKEPMTLSAPELEVPELSMMVLPPIKVQPIPPPSFHIWEDEDEAD